MVLLAYTVCTALCDPINGGGGSGTAPSAPHPNARKLRVLNPGLSRMFRMLRSTGISDDDEVLVDDDGYFQKRQYDDYGHMRFGKRNPKDFDDYGHMRFGK
ncbi:Drosulfakinin [Orchesella cincta]|uniref:Drosulfakinin n=1 Tax=Orchesella cincta TaxID=48709 RepID=A0A1D2NHQ5_ORCCI|nr:Drosulfakinin [Orchesella cincta]